MSAEPGGALGHWEGPREIFDALVRDAMSWRAATLHPPRLNWNGLRDVVIAYVSDAPVPGGDSDRAVVLAAVDRLADAHAKQIGPALPAPEPPPGPWRVAQNAGATPQPRYVELWEADPYGAVWKSNGFPTAEEAQAVCDALNAVRSRERK